MRRKRMRETLTTGDLRVERRAEGEAERVGIVGTAAVYDREYPRFEGLLEVVRPGAFTKTLLEGDARALVNHEPRKVLGRVSSGTLELRNDAQGLHYRIPDPPDATYARDLMVNLARRDVRESSIGFTAIQERFVQRPDGMILRELSELELLDVSPVTYPANVSATAEIEFRSALADRLEDAGLTPAADRLRIAATGPEQSAGAGFGAVLALRRRRLELETRA